MKSFQKALVLGPQNQGNSRLMSLGKNAQQRIWRWLSVRQGQN